MANKTFNLRDGLLEIFDNTPSTPLKITLVLDEGDLSITIPGDEFIDVRDRGAVDHLRKGDIQFMTFSFTAKYTGVHASAADTLYDVLAGLGTSWVLTAKTGSGYDLLDGGDVPLIQMKFTVTKGQASVETITLPNIPLPQLVIAEGNDYNTISVSGTSCQGRPIIATS